MKKRVYRVRTQYIFEGVFEVVAESREEARQKVIQDCGMVMGGSIHSTLPDEEINWAFSTHPEVKTGRITVQEEQTTKCGRQICRPLLSFVSFGRKKKGAKKPR